MIEEESPIDLLLNSEPEIYRDWRGLVASGFDACDRILDPLERVSTRKNAVAVTEDFDKEWLLEDLDSNT